MISVDYGSKPFDKIIIFNNTCKFHHVAYRFRQINMMFELKTKFAPTKTLEGADYDKWQHYLNCELFVLVILKIKSILKRLMQHVFLSSNRIHKLFMEEIKNLWLFMMIHINLPLNLLI